MNYAPRVVTKKNLEEWFEPIEFEDKNHREGYMGVPAPSVARHLTIFVNMFILLFVLGLLFIPLKISIAEARQPKVVRKKQKKIRQEKESDENGPMAYEGGSSSRKKKKSNLRKSFKNSKRSPRTVNFVPGNTLVLQQN